MEHLALVVLAVALCLVAGSNDGSTIIALNLTNKAMSPLWSIVVLAAIVAIGPFVLGTAVATTVAHGLVSFEGRGGIQDVLIAVSVALAIIVTLGRLGLPSSITLALVGSIVGVGLATGRAVSWPAVETALVVGIAAPVLSGAIGWLAARWLRVVPWRTDVRRQTRFLHGGAFVLQAVAYAANDAQKLFAVMALAAGGAGAVGRAGAAGVAAGPVAVEPITQVAIALAFSLGILLGIRRYAGRLAARVVPQREAHSIAAKLGASIAVLGSAALGVPVSMTQSSAAGLVGAGMSEAVTRVRWPRTMPIFGAWIVTLPAATVVAIAVAAAFRMIG